MTISLSPLSLRRFYWQAYRGAPLIDRLFAAWRPAICPFEPLVDAVPPGSRILDLGCGAGALLVLLAAMRRITAGIGCDPSRRAIAAARRAASMVEAACVEFHRIETPADVPPGPFDVVLMVDVMHHLPTTSQQDTLLAIAGRMNKGGLLVYKDMAMQPAWRRLGNTVHDLIVARQLVNYVPIARVEKWMQSAGFAAVRAERFTRLIYAHELLVFEKRTAHATSSPAAGPGVGR